MCIRKYLTQPRCWVRVLLLCAVLSGSFSALSVLPLSGVVHAASLPNIAQLSRQKVDLSHDGMPGETGQKLTLPATSIAASLHAKSNTSIVTARVKNVFGPHVVTRSQLTPPPILGPDLSVNVVSNASIYNVGDTVTFTLTVSENPAAITPIASSVPILLTDSLPLGLTAVTVATTPVTSWAISTTGTTSPILVTATYTGPYPIAPGTTLPEITLTGTAAAQGVGPFADTASVTALGDVSLPNETSTANVSILPVAVPNPTVVSTLLPTATVVSTVTPTVISTVTVMPTATATVAPVVTTTSIPTVAPTMVPIVALPATPTVAPISSVTTAPVARPSLVLAKTNTGGNSFTVGQSVAYTLIVRDLSTAGPEIAPNSVTVTDVMPIGLQQINATATDWHITLSSATSPTVLLATYVGSYPIAPGQSLSPISVSAVLTSAAVPAYTNTAVVTSPDDPGQSNANQATDTITVSAVSGTAVPAVTPTIASATTTTSFGTPTATATVAAIAPIGQETIFPDLAITQTHLGSGQFTAGQQLTSILTVSDLSTAGAVLDANSITVLDVISVGEQNLVASGTGWSFTSTAQISPAIITATYVGSYPITGGTTLPPITVTATLTTDAIAGVTATARVSAPGNAGTHSLASDTIFALSQTQQQDNNNHPENNKNGNGNRSNDQHSGSSNNNVNSNNNDPNNGSSNNGGSSSSSYPALPLTGSDPAQ